MSISLVMKDYLKIRMKPAHFLFGEKLSKENDLMENITSRREALKILGVSFAAVLAACSPFSKTSTTDSQLQSGTATQAHNNSAAFTDEPTATQGLTETSTVEPQAETPSAATTEQNLATVFMTTTISADGLLRIYQALGRAASGNVAVKISSGEPGGHHFLAPDLIAPLVQTVTGTIVECNTAYGGQRAEAASHQRVLEAHGFTAIAPVDVMDRDGTMSIPIVGGKHLKEDVIGSHFANYDFVVNLAHFKGHAMGGFGGVIKNMSIGIASSAGKCLIHSAGASSTSIWGGDQDSFLESMAEAAKGVADYLGENILYINVMNNLSVDCDCDSNPAAPTMADIGILASLDPVALDQACVDLVYAAPDGADLIERMESRNGIHTLEHAAAIGLGSRVYELVPID